MKFDYEEVEGYCVKLETCVNSIDAIIDNYTSNIKKISSSSIWEGDASLGFIEKTKYTETALLTMKDTLLNSIAYVRECGEKINDLEKSIIEALNKLFENFEF